ncbi:MAG: putative cobaltochelatase [Syntrophobacteraceae bacterium]
MRSQVTYPFSAIVGQERMKRALILNAIQPRIGGLLIRGEKGTAKSTAVRALAELLPEIAAVEGCPYSCHPSRPDPQCDYCRKPETAPRPVQRRVRVVDLPLNATEDRVIGGMDFEAAIRSGKPRFQPGLLALAHRGILYVDEVNLLDDHLVDILLDASASGENVVEREGISFRHPARFILVGTMNPEEGELRPQFLDRFGLCIEVSGAEDVEARVRLMERREAFDLDPNGFTDAYRIENAALAKSIVRARDGLPRVCLSSSLRGFISEICLESNVAGHRADLVIERVATAIAAWNGREEVTENDIREAAEMALLHRRREVMPPQPPPEPPKQEENHDHPEEDQQEQESEGTPEQMDEPQTQTETQSPESLGEDAESSDRPMPVPREQDIREKIFAVGETFKVKRIERRKDRLLRRGSGRRSRTRTSQKQGRYVKSSLQRDRGDLALDATLRAAAPHQGRRVGSTHLAVAIRDQDIREKVREKRIGTFLLFLVDASGSMGAQNRMVASKGAIMSLLLDAYQKRDRVALVSFRGREAATMLPPTCSIDLAGKLLQDLPVGGRTPLSAGLARSYEVVRNQLIKEPSSRPIVVLITDGKSNVALSEGGHPLRESLSLATSMARDDRIKFIVVDTEPNGMIRFGLAHKLAESLGAEYCKIEDLKANKLLDVVRRSL